MKTLIARSVCAFTTSGTGSLHSSSPGGIVTLACPLNVSARSEAGSMAEPLVRSAMCAPPMANGTAVNLFVNLTRACVPPSLANTFRRSVWLSKVREDCSVPLTVVGVRLTAHASIHLAASAGAAAGMASPLTARTGGSARRAIAIAETQQTAIGRIASSSCREARSSNADHRDARRQRYSGGGTTIASGLARQEDERPVEPHCEQYVQVPASRLGSVRDLPSRPPVRLVVQNRRL